MLMRLYQLSTFIAHIMRICFHNLILPFLKKKGQSHANCIEGALCLRLIWNSSRLAIDKEYPQIFLLEHVDGLQVELVFL